MTSDERDKYARVVKEYNEIEYRIQERRAWMATLERIYASDNLCKIVVYEESKTCPQATIEGKGALNLLRLIADDLEYQIECEEKELELLAVESPSHD